MDYGAVGDGVTDNAAAIQKAVNACSEAGGGRVVFPAGNVFMAGPVELKSNVELHLEDPAGPSQRRYLSFKCFRREPRRGHDVALV